MSKYPTWNLAQIVKKTLKILFHWVLNWFSKEFIAHFYVHQIEWGKVRSGNYDFLESKMVRNMTSSMFGIFKLKLECTKTAVEQCKSLIALIDPQLTS